MKTLKATRPTAAKVNRPVHVGEAEALGDAGAGGEELGPSLPGAGRVHQPGLPPFGPAGPVVCLLEIGFEDLQRGRRGGFGPEAAFLDRHRGDDTRDSGTGPVTMYQD